MTKNGEPRFTRKDVARILNVATLTVRNREKRGQYPEPRRDLNRYRVYSLHDVMSLQLITYGRIDTRTILSVLFDKGYQDPKELGVIMDEALSRRSGSVPS